jgi:Alpha-L-arabinofuranosidase B, catalytic
MERRCRPLFKLAWSATLFSLLWLTSGVLLDRNPARTGAVAAPAYFGPCDVVAGGCAEAYSVDRAMTAKYPGPLFQLYNGRTTLEVQQTSARAADMSRWPAFCGAMTPKNRIATSSTCRISKIYGQIHPANSLVPSVFKPPYGVPDCSGDVADKCAAAFAIEVATGRPIIQTTNSSQYTIAGDAPAVGVEGGASAISVMYNGKAVPRQLYCCGVFGLTHKYNDSEVLGSDFMVALAYGRPAQGNLVLCATGATYCAGAEEESVNDVADYGSSPADNAIVLIVHDPRAASVTGYLNGGMLFVHHPPARSVQFPNTRINAGTAIHLGGGGDLSVPAPAVMREAFITNTVMSGSDQAAAFRNMAAFYRELSFRSPR